MWVLLRPLFNLMGTCNQSLPRKHQGNKARQFSAEPESCIYVRYAQTGTNGCLRKISSWGAFLSFASFLFFIGVMAWTLTRGKVVTENNPWNEYADTLEWTLPSPPPEHTFEQLPKREDWDIGYKAPASMKEWVEDGKPTT